MIPNHKHFIEAIHAKHKVCLRFYSLADSGVIDLVCAPMDYGPAAGVQDGVNRYWLWDYTSNTGSPILGLRPDQVLDIRVLGKVFDPAELSLPRQPGQSLGIGDVHPDREQKTLRESQSRQKNRPVPRKRLTPLAIKHRPWLQTY